MSEMKIINKCVEVIKERTNIVPEIGMVLGSGLGDYADKIENKVIIPYTDLPNFPVSTVQGHEGQFVIGSLFGKNIIAMQGRVHFYEGYTQRQITMPIRIMKLLGVKNMIITNAAGGVNRTFKPGTLMVINDHINFSGAHPLIGENLEEFGTRFPDMTTVYNKEYNEKIMQLAAEENIELRQGVYMMFSGPSYETPAEVKFASICGADAVGMSTVPEAIVCAHSGISVLGISCITNPAAGILDQPLNHKEVVETAAMVKKEFIKTLDLVIEKVM